jgi:4-hydroxybenzoate polyprenyltransferase
MDFKNLSRLVKIEQSLFALPFAYLGVLFAGGGAFMVWLWVTLGLVAGRTAGMSFARLVDADIDAKNPRARHRALPSGRIARSEVLVVSLVSCAALVFAAYMLNDLCLYLSFPVIAVMLVNPYVKRFSAASHLFLGLVRALAPMGGYIAVTGRLLPAGGIDPLPFLLGFAVMAWAAGLDVVSALLDVDFHGQEGLRTVPVRYGRARALVMSAALYASSIAALAGAGAMTSRGLSYWVSLACVAVIFFFQQKLARREDLDVAVRELFQINAFIPPVLLIGMVMDMYLR